MGVSRLRVPVTKRIARWFVDGETRLGARGASAYVPIGVLGGTGLKCPGSGLGRRGIESCSRLTSRRERRRPASSKMRELVADFTEGERAYTLDAHGAHHHSGLLFDAIR